MQVVGLASLCSVLCMICRVGNPVSTAMFYSTKSPCQIFQHGIIADVGVYDQFTVSECSFVYCLRSHHHHCHHYKPLVRCCLMKLSGALRALILYRCRRFINHLLTYSITNAQTLRRNNKTIGIQLE